MRKTPTSETKRGRAGSKANRVVWQGCIGAAELLILITQLEAAFSASRRPGLRNKLTGNSIGTTVAAATTTTTSTTATDYYYRQRRYHRHHHRHRRSTSINTVFPALQHRHHPSAAAALRGYWLNATHPTPSTGSRPRLSLHEARAGAGGKWVLLARELADN